MFPCAAPTTDEEEEKPKPKAPMGGDFNEIFKQAAEIKTAQLKVRRFDRCTAPPLLPRGRGKGFTIYRKKGLSLSYLLYCNNKKLVFPRVALLNRVAPFQQDKRRTWEAAPEFVKNTMVRLGACGFLPRHHK